MIPTVICTPDRKCKSRVCHVNMLKAYVACYVNKVNALKSVSTRVLPQHIPLKRMG